MIDPLTELAIRHGTDKFGFHDYTPNYWQLFRDWRERPVRMLEIGVGGYADSDRGGESLAMWRDFFPEGRILGIDIQEKQLDLGPRVAIRQGSQVDPEFMHGLEAEFGPFDIIVDDGSHRNEHVIETFELMFPGLASPGIYVVEDTQTAFHPRFGGSLELTQPNSVGYFADLFVRVDHMEIDAFHGGGPDPVASTVRAMHRFHNMIAVEKGDNTYPSNFNYDAGHPRAAAAIAEMGRVLDAASEETGLLGYARLLQQTGQSEALERVVDRLTAAGCTRRSYYSFATSIKLARRDLEAARRLAEAAHAAYPEDPVFLVRLASAHLKAGDRDAAIAALEAACAVAPRDLMALTQLANTLAAAGRPEEALDRIEAAIALRPNRAASHYHRARILMALDRGEKARAALRTALEHEPGHAKARALLESLEDG
ncbi:MAG: tetratricopeptide repeat protein [Alphaproteobacteria bacterium]|nr:MAG: tetratricopeptide repeat protein [Alphaproteobacteria bacterium]